MTVKAVADSLEESKLHDSDKTESQRTPVPGPDWCDVRTGSCGSSQQLLPTPRAFGVTTVPMF